MLVRSVCTNPRALEAWQTPLPRWRDGSPLISLGCFQCLLHNGDAVAISPPPPPYPHSGVAPSADGGVELVGSGCFSCSLVWFYAILFRSTVVIIDYSGALVLRPLEGRLPISVLQFFFA
jgi:hypothetical protein